MSNYTGSDIFDDTQQHHTQQIVEYAADHPENGVRHQKIAQASVLPHGVKVLSPNDHHAASSHHKILAELTSMLPTEHKKTPNLVIWSYPPKSPKTKSESESESDYNVSEEFVKKFNENLGNSGYLTQARRLLTQTCVRGGLVPSPGADIDIPAARKNLAILSSIDNHEIKMASLDYLLKLLEKDDLSKKSAFNLVPLDIYIMKQMDRELMQTQLVEVQIKICKIYGVITELIQRHSLPDDDEDGLEHLGAITAGLKSQLIDTANKLEDLNARRGTHLHFLIEFALEGIKRLKDDKKELYEIVEKIFNTLVAATLVKFDALQTTPDYFENIFKSVDLNLLSSWYDGALICNGLAKNAMTDRKQLKIFQAFVSKVYRHYNWKFLYNAMIHFGDLAIKSPDKEIREAALKGSWLYVGLCPGLLNYVDVKEFSPSIDFKPLQHISLPRRKHINPILRGEAVFQLKRISQESPDQNLRIRARIALLEWLQLESNEKLKESLGKFIPKAAKMQQDWLNERGDYIWVPPVENIVLPGLIDTIKRSDSSDKAVEKIATQVLQISTDGSSSSQSLLSSTGGSSLNSLSVQLTPPVPVNLHLDHLSECLGISKDELKNKTQEIEKIFTPSETTIILNRKGGEYIASLVKEIPSIHTLNFTAFQLSAETFQTLAPALDHGDISLIRLKQRLNIEEARELANILGNHSHLELDLGSYHDYTVIGDVLLQRGHSEEAAKYFDKGISKADSPKVKSKLHYKLGQALEINGETSKSIHHYHQALEHDPKYHRAAVGLANAYKEMGSTEEAKIWSHKARALSSSPRAN